MIDGIYAEAKSEILYGHLYRMGGNRLAKHIFTTTDVYQFEVIKEVEKITSKWLV